MARPLCGGVASSQRPRSQPIRNKSDRTTTYPRTAKADSDTRWCPTRGRSGAQARRDPSRLLEAADDRDAYRSSAPTADGAGSHATQQPVRAGAVRARDPRVGRAHRAWWPVARAHRQAHRSFAPGQVPRRCRRCPCGSLVGWLQSPHQRGAIRRTAAADDRPPRDARRVRARLLSWAPIPGGDARCVPTPRRPGRASSAATCSGCPAADELAGFAPDFTIVDAPSFRAEPERDGVRSETVILVHLGRQEITHRRHRVRGRDQEGCLRHPQLSIARRGRAADALVRQRGRRWRRGHLLRPVRDGQDDPLRRPAAHPHRRRRAWLGSRRRVQLRGWLLRQDHPAVAYLRARHLLHDPALRDHPRERGHRCREPRARSRLGGAHREHARRLSARVHQQQLPDRPRRTPVERHLPDRGCVRGAAAHLPSQSGPGAVPLHQRLHRQARRDRGRRQGADRHLLDLLRSAIHAPPSGRVCADAGRSARPARRARLDGQHRLDRRSRSVWASG